jgi:hypothetical protein
MTGTYGGTLSVDDSNNKVVGGSLVITGSIADEVYVSSTWWVRQYNDVAINFATNTVTSSGFACYDTWTAPVDCSTPGVIDANTAAANWTPLAGIASQDFGGAGGTFYEGATFDANTGLLQIFRDGRRFAPDGVTKVKGADVLSGFVLQTQVVPVPAAAWLFGSAAVALMGFARRKIEV